MQSRGAESRDVRHIHHEDRADFLYNLRHALKVDHAGVRTCARNDKLRLDLAHLRFKRIVIYESVVAYSVGNEIVDKPRHIYRASVGEMSAVREIHAHHGVSGLEECEVNRKVSLRAGVGLNIGVLGAEQTARALYCNVFDDIDAFASAVVAVSRISLGILVDAGSRHCEHDLFGYKVFTCDKFETASLTVKLGVNRFAHFGVVGFQKLDNRFYHFISPFRQYLIKQVYPKAGIFARESLLNTFKT